MKKQIADKRLWVKPETHKKVHKRKLDRNMKDADEIINHLLDVEKEVNRRK